MPEQLRQIEQFWKNFTMNCFFGEHFCRRSGRKFCFFHRLLKNHPPETTLSGRFQRSERRPMNSSHNFTWGNSVRLLPYLLPFGGQCGCPTPWALFSFQRSSSSVVYLLASTTCTLRVCSGPLRHCHEAFPGCLFRVFLHQKYPDLYIDWGTFWWSCFYFPLLMMIPTTGRSDTIIVETNQIFQDLPPITLLVFKNCYKTIQWYVGT